MDQPIGSTKFPAGIGYSLGDSPAIEGAYPHKYNGCGNGFIIVDKATGEVVEMSYADDGVTITHEQNLVMCDDAGRVLREDDKQIVFRANFSCWTACLF